MDIHQELQFCQNERISKDSENCKVSILDGKGNVYGSKASGIDIDRRSIVSAPYGSEAKGLDFIQNPSGFREEHGKVIDFRNGGNKCDKDRVSMLKDIFGSVDGSCESVERKGSMDKPIVSVKEVSSPNGDRVSGSLSILLDVRKTDSVVDDERVLDEDKNFVAGDIVWVMMKTKLWWPGIINEVSKKFNYKNCFLVKLFSSPSSVWASKSEVKEFTCCYDEMVKQDCSRTFLAAVDRAVNEISTHVKKELTCSCVQKPCPPKGPNLKSFGLSQFQPEKFLSFIKNLAVDYVVSQRVEITVTRDCVSSFYRSLGHPQLQAHQLTPNRNSARKRARIETETESSNKDLKENCVYGCSPADILKIVNFSSKDMFVDLCWAAVDGSVGKERRYSSPLRSFFSCFRAFAFSRKKRTEKPKEEGNCDKSKKKRQRKLDFNPESVEEGQSGLEETKRVKRTYQKRKKGSVSEANVASKIPDLNKNVSGAPAGSFPVMGQHAMSSVGVFPVTGQHAMSSVGYFPIIGHGMPSVGYIQIPGFSMPSGAAGVQTAGHAMSSVGGFSVPVHAMSSVGGFSVPGHVTSSVGIGAQSIGHATASVGLGVQSIGHATPSVGGFPVPVHAMPSAGAGVQTTGQTMPSVGGFPFSAHALPSFVGTPIPGHATSSAGASVQTNGHAMSSAGAGAQTTGHAMSSAGGFPIPLHIMSSFVGAAIPGHAMSSVGGGIQSTGHSMSSSKNGFQINRHAMSSNKGTDMGSEFINNGFGWLDSSGNSMSFVQLLNDVQGGKGYENNTSFSRPVDPNHINFTSQSQTQTNPIPPPELKKRQKRKPKEKNPLPILVNNTLTYPSLPDLNRTTTPESNSNHQQTDKPKINKPPPSRNLCPKNGYKPVTLPSPPGFGPPRTNAPSSSSPDLAVFMKQKIEMMKSTMEKAGNNLSAEMREKLENEIRGFTDKYNSMLASSSS